jgi:hypothetical protein
VKKILLPLVVVVAFSSCATLVVDNQKILYELSKKSIPNSEDFMKVLQPGQFVLILNTNDIKDGKVTVKCLSDDNHGSNIELPDSSISIIEDGINSELVNRKINVVDKIVDSNWKIVSRDQVQEEHKTGKSIGGNVVVYGDHGSHKKLLTFRVIGYAPKGASSAGYNKSKIRYILRVIDTDNGLVQYSAMIDQEYNDEDVRNHASTEKSTVTPAVSTPMHGALVGVGVILKHLTVIKVIPNSPASRFGIVEGDQIIEVDGKSLVSASGNANFEGSTLQDKVQESYRARLLYKYYDGAMLNDSSKGALGTKVNFKIVRQGQEDPISVTLEKDRMLR